MGNSKNEGRDIDQSTRERLLKEATKLFAEKGFAQTTVREIARKSDCNLGLVSYYFDGKEKLYRCIFQEFVARIIAKIESIRKTQGTDQQAFSREAFVLGMRMMMKSILEEFDVEPEIKRLLQREMLDGMTYAREVFDEQLSELIQKVTLTFERAQQLGYVKKSIDALSFTIIMNRAIEGYVFCHMAQPKIMRSALNPFTQRDRFLDTLQEILFEGVLT